MYTLHNYVAGYSTRVAEVNTELKSLVTSKQKIELYKKILLKGSKEQEQMDTYILSGDNVFATMTSIEKDIKKIGLAPDDGLILSSIAPRDNETLKAFNAREVVVDIVLQGDTTRINTYVDALANAPFVSHIEKVVFAYSENKLKTKAVITLVITELI